jgi:hypothetical protein
MCWVLKGRLGHEKDSNIVYLKLVKFFTHYSGIIINVFDVGVIMNCYQINFGIVATPLQLYMY